MAVPQLHPGFWTDSQTILHSGLYPVGFLLKQALFSTRSWHFTVVLILPDIRPFGGSKEQKKPVLRWVPGNWLVRSQGRVQIHCDQYFWPPNDHGYLFPLCGFSQWSSPCSSDRLINPHTPSRFQPRLGSSDSQEVVGVTTWQFRSTPLVTAAVSAQTLHQAAVVFKRNPVAFPHNENLHSAPFGSRFVGFDFLLRTLLVIGALSRRIQEGVLHLSVFRWTPQRGSPKRKCLCKQWEPEKSSFTMDTPPWATLAVSHWRPFLPLCCLPTRNWIF